MSSISNMVHDFMIAFGQAVTFRPKKASEMTPEELVLRVQLVVSEAMEFAEACGVAVVSRGYSVHPDSMHYYRPHKGPVPDPVAIADALGDLAYVVQGSALTFGTPLHDVVKEIHRSNMTKLGADGKPVYGEYGRVEKGPNYERPDLLKVLVDHGYDA